MFIGDYPNIHDGSLLYLVQLEGGSRMKVKRSFISTDTCSNFELAKQSPNEDCCQTDHFYVNNIKVGRIDAKNAWSYIMLACSTVSLLQVSYRLCDLWNVCHLRLDACGK